MPCGTSGTALKFKLTCMVKFVKDVERILPYNRQQYIDWLDEDVESLVEWFGVSFQVEDNMIGGFSTTQITGNTELLKASAVEIVKLYRPLVENIISAFKDNLEWIVNHDDKDLVWFRQEGETLPLLRALFRQNKVPNIFKGALVFDIEGLSAVLEDLISYPYAIYCDRHLLYKNIDFSHSILPFILKTTGHGTIDLLSTNKELLKNIIGENANNSFVIKQYRGTSL
jgi:hypothetical protein